MSRLLIKLIGVGLMMAGIYFFANNIIIFSSYYTIFLRRLPGQLSGLALISGIFSLLFFRRETGNLGWFLIAIGLTLVFFSGGVYFKATTLWNLFMAVGALAFGYQLLNTGKVRF